MTRGTIWLLLAVFNVYLGGFLHNQGQQTFSLIVAAYCAVVAVFYFYFATRVK